MRTSLPKDKMADSDIREELTVEIAKRSLVANAFERIHMLFNVVVHFSSSEESARKSGIQWLELKGEKECLAKAKVRKCFVLVVLLVIPFSFFEMPRAAGHKKTSVFRLN